jgi:phosphoribosylanthranilate isomerase
MSHDGGTTFVKICGITRLADARTAVRAGANAIGFVFAPSPRRVTPSRARAITSRVHPTVRRIGVFVDAEPDQVLRVVGDAGLDGVQLQGSEEPDHVREIRRRAPHLFILKAIRIGGPDPFATVRRFLLEARADAVMLDTKDPADPTADLVPIALDAPAEAAVVDRVVVAGGLTPDNVGAVIRGMRPWGVDVSRGVESEPGRKDPAKISAFLRAVREAETT